MQSRRSSICDISNCITQSILLGWSLNIGGTFRTKTRCKHMQEEHNTGRNDGDGESDSEQSCAEQFAAMTIDPKLFSCGDFGMLSTTQKFFEKSLNEPISGVCNAYHIKSSPMMGRTCFLALWVATKIANWYERGCNSSPNICYYAGFRLPARRNVRQFFRELTRILDKNKQLLGIQLVQLTVDGILDKQLRLLGKNNNVFTVFSPESLARSEADVYIFEEFERFSNDKKLQIVSYMDYSVQYRNNETLFIAMSSYPRNNFSSLPKEPTCEPLTDWYQRQTVESLRDRNESRFTI